MTQYATSWPSRFAVVAATAYDNWRHPFDTLDDALAFVRSDPSSDIHDVWEFDEDGHHIRLHGTYRAGQSYEDAKDGPRLMSRHTYEEAIEAIGDLNREALEDLFRNYVVLETKP